MNTCGKKVKGEIVFFSLLFFFFCFFKGMVGVENKIPSEQKQTLIYWINIEGEIDLGLAPFIKRVVREADEENIQALILQINTFGGRLDAAVQGEYGF